MITYVLFHEHQGFPGRIGALAYVSVPMIAEPLVQRPQPLRQPVFDFRAHFCHSAPMETHAFGFKLRANAPGVAYDTPVLGSRESNPREGQKRFPISCRRRSTLQVLTCGPVAMGRANAYRPKRWRAVCALALLCVVGCGEIRGSTITGAIEGGRTVTYQSEAR
jgi:hypothetical protein